MNLIDLVNTYLSQPLQTKNNGQEFYGACPFCLDGEDRFRVWLKGKFPHYWCRVCGSKGGAINLVMRKREIPFREAADWLQENDYDMTELHYETQEEYKKPKLPAPTMQSACQVKLDYKDIEGYYLRGRQKAIDYLSQWGLTATAIDAHMFGWCDEKNALTIPHWWIQDGHVVKGLKFRHMTNDKKMRFSQVKGGDLSGVWNPKWVSNPDGSRIGPELDYLLIVEAEKDAALLEDMGYPTISYLRNNAWNDHLNTVLHRVLLPIIISDVDDKQQGMYSALQIAGFIKQRAPIISTIKQNVKSPSDLAKRDGVNAIHEWLQSQKLGVELCPIG